MISCNSVRDLFAFGEDIVWTPAIPYMMRDGRRLEKASFLAEPKSSSEVLRPLSRRI
jgi:hypothetical protein